MNKPEIPEVDRIAAMLLVQEGYTYAQIAEKLKISKGAISKIKNRLDETGSYKNRLRSGRPIISTPADNRQLVRLIRKNRMSSSISLSHQWTLSSGQKASPRTVRRRLFERNYLWSAAAKKPRLTKAHISARLAFCKQHQSWSFEQWSKVLFSDEMNIEVDNRKCRIMLRRLPSEKYHEDCIAKRTRAGSGSTGLWVVMSSDGLGIYKLFKGRLNQFFYCTSISWITT